MVEFNFPILNVRLNEKQLIDISMGSEYLKDFMPILCDEKHYVQY